jgi:hypothetical protein
VNGKNLRFAMLAVVVVALGVFTYNRFSGKAAVIPKPQLKCTMPSAFNMAMGHTQPLHDKSGAAVVQLAMIAPNGGLAQWATAQDFDAGDHGQLVAFICATESYDKLGLRGGSDGNELWLRHAGAGDDAANWEAFIHHVGGGRFARLVVYQRDTTDAKQHPPGHAQWVDGDENIWVSCGRGCCYVTGGGGSDTTK